MCINYYVDVTCFKYIIVALILRMSPEMLTIYEMTIANTFKMPYRRQTVFVIISVVC